jgi:hypothetical protein
MDRWSDRAYMDSGQPTDRGPRNLWCRLRRVTERGPSRSVRSTATGDSARAAGTEYGPRGHWPGRPDRLRSAHRADDSGAASPTARRRDGCNRPTQRGERQNHGPEAPSMPRCPTAPAVSIERISSLVCRRVGILPARAKQPTKRCKRDVDSEQTYRLTAQE